MHYNVGRDNPMFGVHRFGKDAPRYGKKNSEETRKKLSKALKGKPKSEQHKRKISEALTGRKLSADHRERLRERQTGRFYSSILRECVICGELFRVSNCRRKTQKTCSKECWKRLLTRIRRGKNNPNYRGGITPEIMRLRHSPQYVDWRDAVYQRDCWTCQQCGQVGGKLQAHHILSFTQYPEKRFAIDNGITLCSSCHQKLHRRLEMEEKRA